MTQNIKTLQDLPQSLSNKTVLVRGDLNVPVQSGTITDTARIERLKPTITTLQDKGARVVVLSHFGRPKGEPNPEFSLSFMVQTLDKLWETPVSFCDDITAESTAGHIKAMANGAVCLLENTRFYAGEEENDPDFARQLAHLGDIFVNDAFSTAHRAHASTEGLAHILPSYAGTLMEEELNALAQALEKPERPVVAVVGGAKISTKLDLLANMIKKVDTLILGGGMANTFLKAKGVEIGNSLCEEDMLETERTIMARAKDENCELILPIDVVQAEKFEANCVHETVTIDKISADMMVLDAGPQTIEICKQAVDNSKTLVWNGPMGAFEIEPFEKGTVALASYAGKRTQAGKLCSVAGGGDTVSALKMAKVLDQFSYISTAGGAFLEWLEGKDLPGVAALKTNNKKAA